MMQFGKAPLHQSYYVTKDKQQIKQWLQLQTEVRKHYLRMLEIDLFARWKEHKLQHAASSREERHHLNSRHWWWQPRGVKMKSGSLVERRMGLSGLSRKRGFTSSKFLPVHENTEGITEHIPAAAKGTGEPRAPWPGRLGKQLPQRASIRLLLLVSPERLCSGADRKASLAVT